MVVIIEDSGTVVVVSMMDHRDSDTVVVIIGIVIQWL